VDLGGRSGEKREKEIGMAFSLMDSSEYSGRFKQSDRTFRKYDFQFQIYTHYTIHVDNVYTRLSEESHHRKM